METPKVDLKFQLFFVKIEDLKLMEFEDLGPLKTARIPVFWREIEKGLFSVQKVTL